MVMAFLKGISGGTTVSGTMVAAHKAGIPVFVTGGIGGVHRGASECKYSCSSSILPISPKCRVDYWANTQSEGGLGKAVFIKCLRYLSFFSIIEKV